MANLSFQPRAPSPANPLSRRTGEGENALSHLPPRPLQRERGCREAAGVRAVAGIVLAFALATAPPAWAAPAEDLAEPATPVAEAVPGLRPSAPAGSTKATGAAVELPAAHSPSDRLGPTPFIVPMATGITATDAMGVLARTAVYDPGIDRAEKACLGRVIAAVALAGCANTRCADPDVYAGVVSLTDLVPGRALAAGQLRLASNRLVRDPSSRQEALGFFRSVSTSCLPDASGHAHITLTVTGNLQVRRVVIQGNEKIWEDEVRNKLLVRAGDVLNPDSPEGMNVLVRQAQAIEALYQRNGFDEAKVKATATVETADEVRVVLDITENRRQRVTQILTRVQTLPPATEAEEEAGLTCPRVTEETIHNASELSADEPFTRRASGKARTRVRARLRRLGFGNPKVEISHDEGSQVVSIDVRPGKCNLLRVFVRDEPGARDRSGFQLTHDDELLDALPFAESGLFEFDEAERGRQDLLGVMENRGHLFAEVQLDFRPVPQVLGGQVESAITYYVTTGYVSQVRGISFPGSGHFSPGELKGVIGTKAYDFLDTGGYAQVGQLLADLEALRQFYRSAGFYEFSYPLALRYPLALPEGVTRTGASGASPRTRSATKDASVFEYRFEGKGFRIRRPHGENFIYVDIPIREGRQTRLGRLQVDGASQIPEAEVRRTIRLRQGDVVSYDLVAQAVRAVGQRYRNTGYFRMELKVLCKSVEPDRDETACTPEALLARQVDVRFVLVEGERVDIGELFVTGNFQTRTDVVLRDMPKPGSRYSADALFEAQRKLRNLGLFTQVAFQYIGDKESPPRPRLAIVVQLVEAQSRHIEASAGFQTINSSRADEAEKVPGLVDLFDHLVGSSDRLATTSQGGVGLSLPNLLLVAEAAYVDRNFASAGKELRLPLKLGITLDGGFLDGFAPWRGSWSMDATRFWERTLRVASILPSYYDARLFGSEFGLRVVAPYFLHDFALGSLDVDRTGVVVELSRRFGRLTTALGTRAGFLRFRDPTEKAEMTSFEREIEIEPRVGYDTTDSPINPTRGFSVEATLPFLNAFILVPKANLSGDTLVAATFLKYGLSVKGYTTFGAFLTLAGHARIGGALPVEGGVRRRLPETHRFRLGGQHGLRGYLNDGLRQYCRNGETWVDGRGRETPSAVDGKPVAETRPCDPLAAKLTGATPHARNDGDAVLNGSLEARFPMARDLGVWGALFWDFGGISGTWTGRSQKQVKDREASEADPGFHPNSLRHGIGVGLRWLLSGQIPVRIDYAFAVGQRCRDVTIDATSGKVSCVADEFGQLNFGVLYSF